jgi:hypothetical protein
MTTDRRFCPADAARPQARRVLASIERDARDHRAGLRWHAVHERDAHDGEWRRAVDRGAFGHLSGRILLIQSQFYKALGMHRLLSTISVRRSTGPRIPDTRRPVECEAVRKQCLATSIADEDRPD